MLALNQMGLPKTSVGWCINPAFVLNYMITVVCAYIMCDRLSFKLLKFYKRKRLNLYTRVCVWYFNLFIFPFCEITCMYI